VRDGGPGAGEEGEGYAERGEVGFEGCKKCGCEVEVAVFDLLEEGVAVFPEDRFTVFFVECARPGEYYIWHGDEAENVNIVVREREV